MFWFKIRSNLLLLISFAIRKDNIGNLVHLKKVFLGFSWSLPQLFQLNNYILNNLLCLTGSLTVCSSYVYCIIYNIHVSRV